MVDQDLKIKLTADFKNAQKAIEDVNKSLGELADTAEDASKESGNFAKSLESLSSKFKILVGTTAAAAAAVGGYLLAVRKVGEISKVGDSLINLEQAFIRLQQAAGLDAPQAFQRLQTATRDLISDFELLQSANQAALLGLDPSKFDQLAASAVKLGQAVNLGPKEALDSLVGALGRGSALLLDNLGVTLKVAEAQEIYASSIGKTVDQLTEQEKTLAFQQAAIQKIQERVSTLGPVVETAGTAFTRLETTLKNAFDEFAKAVAENENLAKTFNELNEAIKEVDFKQLGNLISNLISLAGQLINPIITLGAKFIGLAQAAGDLITLDFDGFRRRILQLSEATIKLPANIEKLSTFVDILRTSFKSGDIKDFPSLVLDLTESLKGIENVRLENIKVIRQRLEELKQATSFDFNKTPIAALPLLLFSADKESRQLQKTFAELNSEMLRLSSVNLFTDQFIKQTSGLNRIFGVDVAKELEQAFNNFEDTVTESIKSVREQFGDTEAFDQYRTSVLGTVSELKSAFEQLRSISDIDPNFADQFAKQAEELVAANNKVAEEQRKRVEEIAKSGRDLTLVLQESKTEINLITTELKSLSEIKQPLLNDIFKQAQLTDRLKEVTALSTAIEAFIPKQKEAADAAKREAAEQKRAAEAAKRRAEEIQNLIDAFEDLERAEKLTGLEDQLSKALESVEQDINNLNKADLQGLADAIEEAELEGFKKGLERFKGVISQERLDKLTESFRKRTAQGIEEGIEDSIEAGKRAAREQAEQLREELEDAYQRSVDFWTDIFQDALDGEFDLDNLEQALKRIAAGFAGSLTASLTGVGGQGATSATGFGQVLGNQLGSIIGNQFAGQGGGATSGLGGQLGGVIGNVAGSFISSGTVAGGAGSLGAFQGPLTASQASFASSTGLSNSTIIAGENVGNFASSAAPVAGVLGAIAVNAQNIEDLGDSTAGTVEAIAAGVGTAIGAVFGGPVGAGIGAVIGDFAGQALNNVFGRDPNSASQRRLGITRAVEGRIEDVTGRPEFLTTEGFRDLDSTKFNLIGEGVDETVTKIGGLVEALAGLFTETGKLQDDLTGIFANAVGEGATETEALLNIQRLFESLGVTVRDVKEDLKNSLFEGEITLESFAQQLQGLNILEEGGTGIEGVINNIQAAFENLDEGNIRFFIEFLEEAFRQATQEGIEDLEELGAYVNDKLGPEIGNAFNNLAEKGITSFQDLSDQSADVVFAVISELDPLKEAVLSTFDEFDEGARKAENAGDIVVSSLGRQTEAVNSFAGSLDRAKSKSDQLNESLRNRPKAPSNTPIDVGSGPT